MTENSATGAVERIVRCSLLPGVLGATFDILNPATGEVMGVAADAGSANVDAAVGAARRTFEVHLAG